MSLLENPLHKALKQNFEVPGYIRRMIQDYLSNRQMQYVTAEGIRYSKITGCVA